MLRWIRKLADSDSDTDTDTRFTWADHFFHLLSRYPEPLLRQVQPRMQNHRIGQQSNMWPSRLWLVLRSWRVYWVIGWLSSKAALERYLELAQPKEMSYREVVWFLPAQIFNFFFSNHSQSFQRKNKIQYNIWLQIVIMRFLFLYKLYTRSYIFNTQNRRQCLCLPQSPVLTQTKFLTDVCKIQLLARC